MASHKGCHIFFIILAFIFFAATVVFNTFSLDFGKRKFDGWYTSRSATVTYKYSIEILPADWSYYVQVVIYFYQLLWLGYGFSTICRKTNDWQGYLYYRPSFMPISLYVVFCINMVLNTAWVFTFDREILLASGPIFFGVALTLYICLAITYRALYNNGLALMRLGHTREIGLVRGFVHNGIAMYASWASIMSLVNIGQLLTHEVGWQQKDVSTMVLGVVALQILAYVCVDLFIIDKFSRYVFTPYIVPVVVLAGIVQNNWEWGQRNSVISAVLLGLSVLTFLFKVIMVIARRRLEPEPILRDQQL